LQKSDANDQLAVTCTAVAATVPGTNATNAGTNTTNPGTKTTNPGTNTTNPGTNTTVPTPLANLIISGLTITGYSGLPATLQPTVTVNLTYTVTNNGTAASPAATFAFWLDRPITPACNDVTGATGALRPLAAGESRAKFLVVTLPGAPGQYTLRLLLDSACIVNEISETDHLASLPYLISTTIGPVANLALTSLALSTSPSSGAFTPGQLVNLTVGVLNNGTAASTSSVLSVFTDSPVTPTCRGLGRAVGTPVDVLAAGSSANITVTVPGPLSFGAKTLQVVLDSECTVIETTRADNVAGVSYTVAAPDFIASNLQVIPLGGPVLQVGTIFSVNATITNVSGVAEGGDTAGRRAVSLRAATRRSRYVCVCVCVCVCGCVWLCVVVCGCVCGGVCARKPRVCRAEPQPLDYLSHSSA
jgi:subtilase family serine protease